MGKNDTENLISALAADLAPVRPLAPPGKRLLGWVLAALPISLILGALVESQSLTVAAERIRDPRLMAEVAAILATALCAGYAALCSVQPGRPRLVWALPVVPFLVWLTFVGDSCWTLWQRIGDQFTFAPHWTCYPSVAATGAVPALVIVLLLRRGAAFNLPLTVVLATLAASALGGVGLRLFHQPDAAVLLFLWQFVATVTFFVLSGLGAMLLAKRRAV